MASLPVDSTLAAEYQLSWDTMHAENARGLISDIRGAIHDALERLKASGWAGGQTGTFVVGYKKERTAFGRQYDVQICEKRIYWDIESGRHSFSVCIDGSLCIGMSDPERFDKQKRRCFGRHVLTDASLSALVKNWRARDHELLIAAIDGICPHVTTAIDLDTSDMSCLPQVSVTRTDD